MKIKTEEPTYLVFVQKLELLELLKIRLFVKNVNSCTTEISKMKTTHCVFDINAMIYTWFSRLCSFKNLFIPGIQVRIHC